MGEVNELGPASLVGELKKSSESISLRMAFLESRERDPVVDGSEGLGPGRGEGSWVGMPLWNWVTGEYQGDEGLAWDDIHDDGGMPTFGRFMGALYPE